MSLSPSLKLTASPPLKIGQIPKRKGSFSTRWALTSYKWGELTPMNGLINTTPFITGRGPPCNHHFSDGNFGGVYHDIGDFWGVIYIDPKNLIGMS